MLILVAIGKDKRKRRMFIHMIDWIVFFFHCFLMCGLAVDPSLS